MGIFSVFRQVLGWSRQKGVALWRRGLAEFMSWPRRARWAVVLGFGLGASFVVVSDSFHEILSARRNWPSNAMNDVVPVVTVPVRLGTLSKKFETYAALLPESEVVIRLLAGATVKKIYYPVGAHVEKGALIAQLTSEIGDLRLTLTKAERERQGIDFKVYKTLLKKNFVSKKEYLDKQIEFRSAEIRDRMSQLENPNEIKAPISGILAEMPFHEGDYIDASQNQVLRIVNTNTHRIEFFIPGNLRKMVKTDTPVLLTRRDVAGAPTQAQGRVRAVSPVIDPKTGAVFVEVIVGSMPDDWVAGMHLQVSVVAEEHSDVLAVPNDAIEKDKDKYYVFKIGDPGATEEVEEKPFRFLASAPSDDELLINRVARVEIQPGITDGIKTEIKAGLDSSDQVVIRGQSSLRSGTKVKIVKVVQD